METQAKLRIYVGGLGEAVTDQDLRNTFSKLGAVEAVEMVRTKGRSFAYIDFLPSSDKSAAKLFSTYNGCAWKGGKLRLEKAKEHYLERMKREWEEDAKLANETRDGDDAKNVISSGGIEEALDENTQIHMYFPMYRKVKSLPYKGTGKHKYSFQRLQAPSHPVHFCDCVEHACDTNTTKGIQICHASMKDGGMSQDEINTMNSVLNKFLEREPHSAASRITSEVGRHASMEDGGMNKDEINTMNSVLNKFLERDNHSAASCTASQPEVAQSDHLPDDQNCNDDSADDDNIVINAVAGPNDMSYLLDSMKKQTGLHAKTTRSKKPRTSADLHSQNDVRIQKVKGKNARKMGKLVQVERNSEDLEFTIPNRKPAQKNQSEGQPESASMKEESGSKKSTGNTLQKMEQVAEKDYNPSLPLPLVPGSISDSEAHTEAAAADRNTASVNYVVEHGEVVLESHPPEQLNEVTNTDLKNATSEKPVKGVYWSQKSSWTQLVASANNSPFSLSQILPETEKSKKSMQAPPSVQWSGFSNSSHATALKRKRESAEEDLDSGKGNTQGFSKKKAQFRYS